jgi:hypothetical protein
LSAGRLPVVAAEAFDLSAQVRLGVEPGAGDLRFAGECVEADWPSGGIEPPQRSGCPAAGGC